MSIEKITEAITEATIEAIRDYDINTCIDKIRTDAGRLVSEIIGG